MDVFILDINDPRYNTLTEISKLIIMEQTHLYLGKKSIGVSNTCMSCKIRSVSKDLSFPCCHYIGSIAQKSFPLLKYDQLPARCFKKGEECIVQFKNVGIHDLDKPNGIETLNGVSYFPQLHNTNFNSRLNVEGRIRALSKRRNAATDIIGIEDMKELKELFPYHTTTVVKGYLTKIPIEHCFVFAMRKGTRKINETGVIEDQNENEMEI